MGKTIASGTVFGCLTVTGVADEVRKTKNGTNRKVYCCRCECGNTINLTSSQLARNRQDCGCGLAEEKSSAPIPLGVHDKVDIISTEDNKQYTWRCSSCGEIYTTGRGLLGTAINYGCYSCRRQAALNDYTREYIGKQFGELTIEQIEQFDKTYLCTCVCSCGKVIKAELANIKRGHTKSCGHIHPPSPGRPKLTEEEKAARPKKKYTPKNITKDGYLLHSGVAHSNTGVRGITQQRDGRYQAHITVNYQRYYLGVFDSLDEAIMVRAEATAHKDSKDLPAWFEQYRDQRVQDMQAKDKDAVQASAAKGIKWAVERSEYIDLSVRISRTNDPELYALLIDSTNRSTLARDLLRKGLKEDK